MPFLKKIIHQADTLIYIWQITETISTLKKELRLNISSKQKYKSIRTKAHKKQFLATQQLLQLAGLNSYYLYYDKNGKPFLNNGLYISISHSNDYAVLAISKKNIGIDIEKKQTKLQRVAPKFIGSEKAFITNDLVYLTKIWTAKEAIYKLKNHKGLSFKKNIHINPFLKDEMHTKGIISIDNKEELLKIYYFNFENSILALAI